MQELYEMIFKRKSFRRFDNSLSLSENELKAVENQLSRLNCLIENIHVKYQIVKREETTCKRGEYCLLVYSERKENYLLNIGYIMEQLDLWMAFRNIGVCWYGMGKPYEQTYKGLDYAIMLAFGKGHPEEFRKDYTKAKRKALGDIWFGEDFADIGNVVRYSPSACNSQPWRVVCADHTIKVYRTTQVKSIIPKDKIPYYNSIDIGIFLCFLEITLTEKGVSFERKLCQSQEIDQDLIEIANYKINNRTID